jgi:hypothetical protein
VNGYDERLGGSVFRMDELAKAYRDETAGAPMPLQQCPGSDKWGAGEDVLGMGRCEDCGQLIGCDSSGILYPHRRKEPNDG